MRIPSDKSTFSDPLRTRDKAGSVESAPRSGDAAASSRPTDAAIPASTLDQTVQDTDAAARAFESGIAARLDQVKDQLRSGNYAVDYERLAQRMMEDGFGS
jgi:anti-sigma28 factor (negative regulator of flagellin synthesis)